MTVGEILEAIRALPEAERVRLVEQLKRELAAGLTTEEAAKMGPDFEVREGFAVYTGPLPDPALDHRVDREERIDELIARLTPERL